MYILTIGFCYMHTLTFGARAVTWSAYRLVSSGAWGSTWIYLVWTYMCTLTSDFCYFLRDATCDATRLCRWGA